MAEYTYKDIIIDPTSEEAKNAIGKKCYMYDSPTMLLKMANSDDGARTLESIDESDYPFNDKEFGSEWTCIIVKKEEPKPKYVPFESEHEFISAYYRANNEIVVNTESMLSNLGMWLWDNEDRSYKLVTEIWNAGVVIGDDKMRITNEEGHIDVFNDTTSWVKLFSEYRFLDGSHCGKEVKDE